VSFNFFLYSSFQSGDHVCFDAWQYAVIFIVIPTLITIPLSFEKCLDLLNEGVITTNTFMVGMVVPPYCLVLHVRNRWYGGLKKIDYSKEEELCVLELLEDQEELLRNYHTAKNNDNTNNTNNDNENDNTDNDNGNDNDNDNDNDNTENDDNNKGQTIRWPIVQLYRNVLIAILKFFILTPLFRSIAFAASFLLFAVHDWHTKPYKYSYLNTLQLLSSNLLLLVTFCNNPSAVTYIMDIQVMPDASTVLSTLLYVEYIAYGVMPGSILLWLFVDFENLKQYLGDRWSKMMRKLRASLGM
jgi:hypothetical protein